MFSGNASGSLFGGGLTQPAGQQQTTLPTFGSQLIPQSTATTIQQPTPLTFGAQPTLSLQQPTPLSAMPSLASFGQTQAPSLFGGTLTQTQPLSLFGGAQPQPTSLLPQPQVQQQPAIQPRGLGGEGAPGGENENVNKTAKDTTNLPAEWLPLVEAFKKFIKEQKTIKEENSQPRFSVEPIQEISSELNESLRSQLQRLDVTLQKNAKAVEKLKTETNALICDAEAGYRAIKSEGFSTSSYGLPQIQYSMPSSHAYFSKMLEEFERQMTLYSAQIKELESHLENMNKPHLPQELLTIIRKQHETLVALAAEVYAIHEEVNRQSAKAKV